MKYFIGINQLVLSKTKLDLEHGAIIDYLISACASNHPEYIKNRIKDEKGDWTWIDYTTLIQEMPLLKFTHISTVGRRIKEISDVGYIEIYRHEGRKNYVRLSAKCEELLHQRNATLAPAQHPPKLKNGREEPYSEKTLAPAQAINILNNKDYVGTEAVASDKQTPFSSPRLVIERETSLDEFGDSRQPMSNDGFDFGAETERLRHSSKRFEQYIALYWKAKGIKCRTREMFRAQYRRDMGDAHLLAAYDPKELVQAIRAVEKDAKQNHYDWKISTIVKKITSL